MRVISDAPPTRSGRDAISVLATSSLCYLLIPCTIFFAGWLRLPYSLLMIAVAGIGLVSTIRLTRQATGAGQPGFTGTRVTAVVLTALVVALIAGAGGWGFQSPEDSDWYKHNAILRDLTEQAWPVVYDSPREPVMLTYYVAYQLPAALLGKVLGWRAANHGLFAVTAAGLCLALLWVQWATTARRWGVLVLFLIFSGMDIVGHTIATLHQAPGVGAGVGEVLEKIAGFRHLEWWIGWGFAQFSSVAAVIAMVPNQAIPGWLLICLIMRDAGAARLRRTGLFYLGLCALWAPFVALGLLPFLLVLGTMEWWSSRRSGASLRDVLTWSNVAGLLMGGMVAVYLAGRFELDPLPVVSRSIYHEQITFTFLRSPQLFVPRYVLFIVLEFALLHTLLYLYLRRQREVITPVLRRCLVLSSCLLLALPVLNWGWNNEPSMRSSIPAIFVTAIVTIRVLADVPLTREATWIRRAVMLVFLVGSLNAAVEWGRQLSGVYHRGALVAVPPRDGIKTLFQIQEEKYRDYYNFVGQYVGSTESFFARHLARRRDPLRVTGAGE